MRLLITGGAGFIGSHLADRLVQDGDHDVVVFDNFTRGRRANLADCAGSIDVIEGDIRDRRALSAAMDGVDMVFHLAAQSNVIGATKDLDFSFTTNVVGTYEVLRAAELAGVQRVVFTSSREVYGEPDTFPVPETARLAPKNAYGVSKVTGEHYCELFARNGLSTHVLRLSNVYGPRDFDRVIPIFLDRAGRHEDLVLYGGHQVLDLVWVGTVVEALVCAGFGEALAGPVNVASGKGTRLPEIASRIIHETGSRSELKVVPAREVEVVRFTADVQRAQDWLGLTAVDDPLAWIPQLCPATVAVDVLAQGR